MNIPNGRSMMVNKFKRIENSIRTVISNVTKKSILASVKEEIQLIFYSENRYDNDEKWKRKELSPEKAGMVVAYDMGQNKGSTGTRYDSISGHGGTIGQLTTKLV